jgi:amidase
MAGVELGMQLLEPGFTASASPADRIGRIRTNGDPAIEAAVDAALAAAGFDVVPVDLDLALGNAAFTAIYFSEFVAADRALIESDPDGVGDDIKRMFELAPVFLPGLDESVKQREQWIAAITAAFAEVELLALPTLPLFPPRIDALPEDPTEIVIALSSHTSPFNAAGTPASAQPVPVTGAALPASLQLVGPANADELVVATARVVEAAVS